MKEFWAHHIEFARSEFGIVREIDALIPELASDLVDPVHAAHHQHLEVQLWSHPHVQPHVEVVVVGDEGARCRPAGDHVHHRSLNLYDVVSEHGLPVRRPSILFLTMLASGGLQYSYGATACGVACSDLPVRLGNCRSPFTIADSKWGPAVPIGYAVEHTELRPQSVTKRVDHLQHPNVRCNVADQSVC